MKNYAISIMVMIGICTTLCGCQSNNEPDTATELTASPITPVTVTSIDTGLMEEYIELNATSQFQQKWIMKANVTGYLSKANVQLNKFVNKGDILFAIKTKEAESIGNS